MKKCALLLGLLAGTALFAACADTPQQDLPELKIGYVSYPPYMEYNEANGATGIEADLATEALGRLGYQPVFVQTDWNDMDDALAAGEIDCIWTGYAITENEDTYQWAGPYMQAHHVAVVPADSSLQSTAELAGKAVAVLGGGNTEEILLDNSRYDTVPAVGQIYSMENLQEMRAALLNGRCDAVCGKYAVWKQLLQNDTNQYRILPQALAVSDLGVAFAKSADPELVASLTTVLEEMKQDGTTDAILQQYGADYYTEMGLTADE